MQTEVKTEIKTEVKNRKNSNNKIYINNSNIYDENVENEANDEYYIINN